MATYNGALFIAEQLESIAAQTMLPAELVVSDDSSTDATLSIIRSFAATAPFPVIIHENKVRLGFRGNFMKCVSLCGSEIIALSDQDDIWEVEKLRTAQAPFQDPEVILCFHEASLIDQHGTHIGPAGIYPLPARSAPLELFPMRNPYGFAMLFRQELLSMSDLWTGSLDNLNDDDRMAHDQWFFFLASVLGTIAFVDEPLTRYRQHNSNAYGIDQPDASLRGKIAIWFYVAKNECRSLSVAAERRAQILQSMASRLSPSKQERSRRGVDMYDKFSEHCRYRAGSYNSASFRGRVSAWFAMYSSGGYGHSTQWTFGRKTALLDLISLTMPRSWVGLVRTPRHVALRTAKATFNTTPVPTPIPPLTGRPHPVLVSVQSD
jgi:glycosyltransferase involved in cell wall biosynthesis